MKRDELIEAIARALDSYAFEALPSGLGAPAVEHCRKVAGKCLTALEATLGIDLTAIAEGRSVVVPVEPTEAMLKAGVSYRLKTKVGGDNRWPEDTAALYRCMIAAKE